MLMKQERYNEAVQLYKSILYEEPLRSEVYYNLGNAYFKLDSLGVAAWAYTKAHLISPRNEDIRYNLNFVNKKLFGDIRLPNKFFLQKFYNRISNTFTLKEWIFIGSLGILLFSIFNFLRKILLSKKILYSYVNLILLTLVLFINILIFNKYTSTKNKEAILVSRSSKLFSEPFSSSGTVLLVVNEGQRLEVIEEMDQWSLVKVVFNSEKGWIQNKSYLEL